MTRDRAATLTGIAAAVCFALGSTFDLSLLVEWVAPLLLVAFFALGLGGERASPSPQTPEQQWRTNLQIALFCVVLVLAFLPNVYSTSGDYRRSYEIASLAVLAVWLATVFTGPKARK